MSEPTATDAPVAAAPANREKAPKVQKPKESGRGIVKAVTSGDSLTVIHIEKHHQGPPQEYELTLTNISAPRLGRRKSRNGAARDDEPYAWQSREYLRKKLVGKQVTYLVENQDPKSGKLYATVFYGAAGEQPENVAVSILSEGWATLRSTVNKERPELAPLVQAEEVAEKGHRGVWNKEEAEKHKRPLDKEVNTTALFDSVKGKPQAGVVESIVTGSRFRIVLHKDFTSIELLLSGVEAPNLPQEGEAQPFAREAKFFSEHWLLNRDVNVLIEGADKYNLYGSVVSGDFHIGEALLQAGLAKFVEWSAQRTAFLAKLRAAEKEAKSKKLRVWQNYVEPKPLSAEEKKREMKSGKEITGKVTRIISAGAFAITDAQNNTHEIFLSSIKLPRGGNPHEKKGKEEEDSKKAREDNFEKTLAWEGKEYARKKLIDQKVRAILDYVRPESKRQTQGGVDTLPERPYFSLYLEKTNIAVDIVEHGLATVQPHKAGENRSRDYEYLLFAEERAKKAQKGLHMNKANAPLVNITDLSQKDALAQAKQFFPSLKRNGKTKGVVEYVFSGSRFKIFVPRESCMINFILAVAKTPRLGSEQSKTAEPFAEQAFRFSATRAQQRDVEFEILDQDKAGNFIGNLWVNKHNLSTQLLEEGLATPQRIALKESEYYREYQAAEEKAKAGRKHLWKDYDPAVEEAKKKARIEAERSEEKKSSENLSVHVTEIVNGNQFYVQVVNNESKQLEDIMKQLESGDNTPVAPTNHALVRAQFTEDDRFYRAKVTKVYAATSEADVKYIDYGNTERLPFARISRLDAAHSALKPQAQLAQLAFLKAPALTDDFGEDAAEYLRELVWDRPTVANVEYRDNDTLFLSLYDHENDVFVNASLLNAGLAKLEKVRGKQYEKLLEKLREEETSARQAHNGIWQYGDVDSDEDEPRRPPPRGQKDPKKPAGKK